MAECFVCLSPRFGKQDIRQNMSDVFDGIDDDEIEDRRDEGEQENNQDEMREEPSPSADSISNIFEFSGVKQSKTRRDNTETQLKQTESKTISKQEEILRKLGILYLDEKVTRARVHDTETDETILRQAGVNLIDSSKQEKKKSTDDEKKELNDKILSKTINERDAKILKESGVLSLAGFPITKDDDKQRETIEYKAPLSVMTSDSTTVASGSVNSSYADRKLRRRLRKGWTSTGRECVCGMPVIALKGSYECVICGLVDDEAFGDDGADDIQQVESHMVGGSPGVFLLSSDTADSTLPSVDHKDEEDEAMRQELGKRLFSGWVLVGTSCPTCNLPMIGNNNDTPALCVRCG